MDLSVTCNNPLVVGRQRAKKVVSDSSGLVDFAFGLLRPFSQVGSYSHSFGYACIMFIRMLLLYACFTDEDWA